MTPTTSTLNTSPPTQLPNVGQQTQLTTAKRKKIWVNTFKRINNSQYMEDIEKYSKRTGNKVRISK